MQVMQLRQHDTPYNVQADDTPHSLMSSIPSNTYSPLISTPSFHFHPSEQNDLQYAVPGGLIGIGTKIDPTLTRADRLVGQVLGLKGHLPEVFTEVEISYYLLRRLLGVKTAEG